MSAVLSIRQAAMITALALGPGLILFDGDAARGQEKAYQSEVLQQEDVGTLEGERTMRMVMLTMEPGAEIPEHQHSGPGMRYIIEGEITIAFSDGEEQTFSAGETYFEGPGASHPAGEMSARNPSDGVTRVLIVETLPKQQ